MSPNPRRRVALVGATGVAGQQFLVSLDRHPWFELTTLAASSRSAGKPYTDAITDAAGQRQWFCEEPLPAAFARMPVVDSDTLDPSGIDLVFTAVESGAARALEERFAAQVPVISTSSAFRYEDDVPILVPGVNLEHAVLVKRQQRERGWKGFVAPIPNCTTTGLVIALAPLARRFGLALGRDDLAAGPLGRRPQPGRRGPRHPRQRDPVHPERGGEGRARDPQDPGRLEGERIEPLEIAVSATCTRVNVRDGHTEAVTAGLGRRASLAEVADALRAFGREFVDLGLPSTPPELIQVTEDPYRPQPRIDRRVNDGMTTVVGRLREDSVLENGIRLVLLSHNTKMGAAKGAVLVAEYLVHRGLA